LGEAVFHTKRIQVLKVDPEASNKKTIDLIKDAITCLDCGDTKE